MVEVSSKLFRLRVGSVGRALNVKAFSLWMPARSYVRTAQVDTYGLQLVAMQKGSKSLPKTSNLLRPTVIAAH
jgi:hypothetical protein